MTHAGGPGAPSLTEGIVAARTGLLRARSAGDRPHRAAATLRRARRRRLRHPRLTLVRAAAALALIAAAVAQLPAQEARAEAAVLVSGPAQRRGLPFLPPNTIEYQRGVYELTEATVEVFYTEAPVFRRGTWTETSCDGRPVDVLPEAGGTIVHYAWPQEQRHAFFRFGPAGAAGDADAVARSQCGFIEAFLERFSFFLETTDSGGAAPFPAVLPR